jgi:hypothetical protein
MPRVLLVLTLSALLAVALLVAGLLWWRLEAVEIGLHGALALGFGAVLSLGLGGGLMALVFYSNRHGYDDAQHGRLVRPPPED